LLKTIILISKLGLIPKSNSHQLQVFNFLSISFHLVITTLSNKEKIRIICIIIPKFTVNFLVKEQQIEKYFSGYKNNKINCKQQESPAYDKIFA